MPVIRARRVVLPDRVVADAGVEVDDRGCIVDVVAGPGPATHHTLVPGLVDMRAQLREPGAEHLENMATASHS